MELLRASGDGDVEAREVPAGGTAVSGVLHVRRTLTSAVMDSRLRAMCDLMVAEAREYAGLHDYDGEVQDLSDAGVRAGVARLGGPPLADAHDEAHLSAFEDWARVTFIEAEEHRRNPLIHAGNLDLAGYDREYAPPDQRADARRRHLAKWPDAIDASIGTLDRVSAPVARGLLGAVQGLGAAIDTDDPVAAAALVAHGRLVDHVRQCADTGDPDPALGGPLLARLMGSIEGLPVDLGRLAERADAERDRLRALLADACARLEPDADAADVVTRLLHDHPDADGVLAEARAQTDEVIAFTIEHNLVPGLDGECRVGPAPPSRRWAMAMMSPAAPFEDDGPSWYHVTPPDPAWPEPEQEQWLQVFSRTTLPAITAHEVAPGHFAHGRVLRRMPTDVRRALHSPAFVEGWAHYTEELCVEEGFRAGDPRFAIGVAIEALVRVTRLAVAIGVHTRAMTMDEAEHRFEHDAHLEGPAARSEAARATFDPTYGRYTWGKLEIVALRADAHARWGTKYSHARFHEALLRLGSPPLGLMGAVLGE